MHLKSARNVITHGFTTLWPNEVLKLNVDAKVFDHFDSFYQYMSGDMDRFDAGTVSPSEINNLEVAIVSLLDEHRDTVRGVWIPGEPQTLSVAPLAGQVMLADNLAESVDMFAEQFSLNTPALHAWSEFFNNARAHCLKQGYYCLQVPCENGKITGHFCSGKQQIDTTAFAALDEMKFPDD